LLSRFGDLTAIKYERQIKGIVDRIEEESDG
jgi:hypothetical protein